MANRLFFPTKSPERELVEICGIIFPQSTSAPTSTGKGFSVARTSAGLFTITLENTYPTLVCATASLSLATPATDHHLVFDAWDSSAGTITITHITGGSAADISADADNWIGFRLSLKNAA